MQPIRWWSTRDARSLKSYAKSPMRFTGQNRGRVPCFLSDRVLRAMAAEGVTIWKRMDVSNDRSDAKRSFVAATRLGRLTDHSAPTLDHPPHQRLLLDVTDHQQPVVVPATPGATDPDVAANPTDVPVAIVPIQNDPTSTTGRMSWKSSLNRIAVLLLSVATSGSWPRWQIWRANSSGSMAIVI